ncbi:YceI family protein [Olleya sp. UBA1516]|uniref:YceI family protein n=1 Tax=Olleya sp. UBA1516 TaxID=1947013 RepID=UPI0025D6D956|nr:YceI family protein [Olleya sp. UBA1516]|tara:strand:+ start:1015 stop:1557 length:543 start_codon:yes stop_codon:yes gene_type:complete
MKYILILVLFVSNMATAQKHFTKTGLTTFKASVDTFEPIEAKNESTTVILNTETGAIAALLFVKAFHFEIALMQEHFNENYMDSDKFPKATFKGQLIDFNMKHLSSEDKEFQLKGTLTIRGKDKLIATVAKLKKQHNKIVITSNLTVKPEEFDIKIPGIVRDKIAKSINLNLHYELVEKK